MDTEGQLYALFYSLYEELESPWILVTEGCPGTSSLRIQRDDYTFTKISEVEVEMGSPGEVGAQISHSHKMKSQEMLSVLRK